MTTADDRPTAAELWANIDPSTLTTDQLLLYELNQSVSDLRGDVQAERKGRRLSIAGLGVAIVVAVFVGGLFATNVERERQQSCRNRATSRQEIRNYGEAIVNEVSAAPLVELTAQQRADLEARVIAVGIRELPPTPPGC